MHPDVPISIHLNGCPNACARTQVADIGLKGMIVTDADGNQVEGFQVHLGGGLGLDAGFGRKLRGLKVTTRRAGATTSTASYGGSTTSANPASGSPDGCCAPPRAT